MMTNVISPDVMTMLLIAFGFAGLVLGFDWLRARSSACEDNHVAAE